MALSLPFDDLSDMLNSSEFDAFIGDRLGNQLAIDDPERFERIQEAAEEGADGSIHAEVIQDLRDFLDTVDIDNEADDDEEYDANECEIDAWRDRIRAEIDAVEQRHAKAGTLYHQVG